MTTKRPATPAAQWLAREASENPKSIAARVLPTSREEVGYWMTKALGPDAADTQMGDWLFAFEKDCDHHFGKDCDALKSLSPSELLEFSNTGVMPQPKVRWGVK